ncbi:Uncharacterised protein [Vibrio cholerae]|nr:Uncharacterised protein [Vibrio cholerae]CSI68484.1 Uncharacterised protein [Vibrio cholerae]CSI75872.1 Uncharacterised protein [Vibrio cholerae]
MAFKEPGMGILRVQEPCVRHLSSSKLMWIICSQDVLLRTIFQWNALVILRLDEG